MCVHTAVRYPPIHRAQVEAGVNRRTIFFPRFVAIVVRADVLTHSEFTVQASRW